MFYLILVPASANIFTVQVIAQGIVQSVSMALFTGAFHFMVAYSFGFGKSDVMIVFSFLAAYIIVQVYMAVCTLDALPYLMSDAIGLLLIAACVLAISYFVAKRLIHKREL